MEEGFGRGMNKICQSSMLSLVPLIAFIVIIFTATHLEAAVYKCINSTGAVTFQAEKCHLDDKSQQMNISPPPKTESTENVEEGNVFQSKTDRKKIELERKQKAKLKRREKACKRLDADFRHRIKSAKARDKASKGKRRTVSGQKPFNRAEAERELRRAAKCNKNRMAGKPCKRRNKRKEKEYTTISSTHYQDLAKTGYEKEKKRLGCR